MSKVIIPKSVSVKLKGVVSRGVKAMEVDERGHLIVTLTDNTVVDLGMVKGDPGVYVGEEEPTDDSVLVWFTDDGEGADSEDLLAVLADMQKRITALEKAIGGGDIPDIPDAPVELDAPSIRIESDNAVKLATPTIRLSTGDDDTGDDDTDSEYTPAILGVAILGRTILGVTDGDYEPTITQLTAPSIRLETVDDGEDEPTAEKLTAPSIKLETVQDETVAVVLTAPEIDLVEV